MPITLAAAMFTVPRVATIVFFSAALLMPAAMWGASMDLLPGSMEDLFAPYPIWPTISPNLMPSFVGLMSMFSGAFMTRFKLLLKRRACKCVAMEKCCEAA